jgi:hypothetical protein
MDAIERRAVALPAQRQQGLGVLIQQSPQGRLRSPSHSPADDGARRHPPLFENNPRASLIAGTFGKEIKMRKISRITVNVSFRLSSNLIKVNDSGCKYSQRHFVLKMHNLHGSFNLPLSRNDLKNDGWVGRHFNKNRAKELASFLLLLPSGGCRWDIPSLGGLVYETGISSA